MQALIASLLRARRGRDEDDDDATERGFRPPNGHVIKRGQWGTSIVAPSLIEAQNNTFTHFQNLKRYGKNPQKLKKSLKDAKIKTKLFDSFSTTHPTQFCIPNSLEFWDEAETSSVYNCKFNQDGSIFMTASRDGITLFDVLPSNKLSLRKRIGSSRVQWAISDADLSPNNEFLIHSTLNPIVSVFSMVEQRYRPPINMSARGEGFSDEDWEYHQRIFTIKISGDNRTFLAGTSATSRNHAFLKTYDLERGCPVNSIPAHEDDINSVCFIDRLNSAIFASASDDTYCKLWDMRIFGSSKKEVGVFNGHTHGLTCVSSKEDNLYIITNSKDQTIKMWDLRKFDSTIKPQPVDLSRRYDYRYMRIPERTLIDARRQVADAGTDNSVATFTGHDTYQTLIRCYFSPKFSTNQRFIYTGGADGRVWIYDTLAEKGAPPVEILEGRGQSRHSFIRDLSWHPTRQSLFVTNGDGMIGCWAYHPPSLEDMTRSQTALAPPPMISSPMEEESVEPENEDDPDYDGWEDEEEEEDYEEITRSQDGYELDTDIGRGRTSRTISTRQ